MLVQDMVIYEARCTLDDNGWQCCIATSTGYRRLDRDTPYKLTDGGERSPKMWWMSRSQASQGSAGVFNNCLNLLLTATDHGVAAPPLVSAGVYAYMMDPSWAPKHKTWHAKLYIGHQREMAGMKFQFRRHTKRAGHAAQHRQQCLKAMRLETTLIAAPTHSA